jgi:hypothetical protein
MAVLLNAFRVCSPQVEASRQLMCNEANRKAVSVVKVTMVALAAVGLIASGITLSAIIFLGAVSWLILDDVYHINTEVIPICNKPLDLDNLTKQAQQSKALVLSFLRKDHWETMRNWGFVVVPPSAG